MVEDRDPSEHEQPAPDSTAPMDAVSDQPEADATASLPAAQDATAPMPAAQDATAPMPAAQDATAPLEGTAAAGGAAPSPRWSARAEVPPAGTRSVRDAAPGDWETTADDLYAGRSWFTPIIVGVVALILLMVLVVGLVLIYRAAHREETPLPATSGTASPTPSAPASVLRTTAPPTPASPTAAAKVTVPADLVGKSEAAARAELAALGLAVQVKRQQNGSVDPGTVLQTDPGPNSQVDPGSTVVLVVATAPPPPPPTSKPAAPSS